MKTKFPLVFVCLVCMTFHGYSQLMHAVGISPSLLTGKIEVPGMSSTSFMVTQSNLTYFPRFNITESENSSLSIGFPVGVGIGIADNAFGDDVGIAFSYDLPAALDYNMGCMSTKENENKFGGYFGGGFGYSRINISKSQYSDFTGTSYGPIARAGMRFFFAKEKKLKYLTVGLFYKKGLEKAKLNTFGTNVLFDL